MPIITAFSTTAERDISSLNRSSSQPDLDLTPATSINSSTSSEIGAAGGGEDDEAEYGTEMSSNLLGSNSMSSSRRGDKNLNVGNSVTSNHPFKAFTFKRLVVGGTIILLCIFWFGKGSGSRGGGGEGDKISSSKELIVPEDLPASSPQRQETAPGGKCMPPPGKKAVSYALMIDAGSTGSRIHVYTFSNCNPSPAALPKLEHEGFFMTKPGLSSFAGKPKEAAESLRVLMEHAMEGIQASERSCTPVAVKATAGLRMLGDKESTQILNEVERWMNEEWPFHVIDDGVVIMDGRDEGVYAWITINYLLGLIGPTNADPSSSAAIMDLGGASTQIVFEPTFPINSVAKLAPGDHVYDLTFAGTKHVLYQHSHLGYGLMQARRAVHNLVGYSYVYSSSIKGKPIVWEKLTPANRIHNPCMHKGESRVVKLDPPDKSAVEVTMVGTGAGFEACRRIVEVMLAKDAQCEEPPCAFAGVYQPSLGEVFGAGKVWALSYFYDRIAPLGLTSPFSISALRTLTSNVCAGPDSPTWSRFAKNKEAKEELADRPEYCLDLTFMYSLLSLGYELEEERELYIGKKVGDVELGWALGAAIAMLDGKLKCRV